MSHHGPLRIVAGRAAVESGFASKVIKSLNAMLSRNDREKLIPRTITEFSNNNTKVRIDTNVRGCDVYLIQQLTGNVNQDLWELHMLAYALKDRCDIERLTGVLPYYPYIRSDKIEKNNEKVCVTAELVGKTLKAAGIDKLICMDPHTNNVTSFFKPTYYISATADLARHVASLTEGQLVIVSPDAGSAKYGGIYADLLKVPLAILDKRRTDDSEKPKILHLIGDVKDCNVLMLDDEICSGGTLFDGAKYVIERGALTVSAGCTHGWLTGTAAQDLEKSHLARLVVTDTVPVPEEKKVPKLIQLSVAELFAEAIFRLHNDDSITEMLANR